MSPTFRSLILLSLVCWGVGQNDPAYGGIFDWTYRCGEAIWRLVHLQTDSVVRSAKGASLEEIRLLLHAPHPGTAIPGEYEKRFSGSMTLTNSQGQPVEVYFATTLHTSGSNSVPYANEVAFLKGAITKRASMKPSVLIEQGSYEVNDNFKGFIRQRKESLEQPLPESCCQVSDELAAASQHAMESGLTTINIDLRVNPKSIPYFVKNHGPLEAMQALAIDMKVLGLETNDAKKISLELARTYAPDPVLIELIQSEFDSYFQTSLNDTQLWAEYSRVASNRRRDQFMAEQIRQSSGPAIVIAHSQHMLGILHHLRNDTKKIALEQVQHSPMPYLRGRERKGTLQQFMDECREPSFYGP